MREPACACGCGGVSQCVVYVGAEVIFCRWGHVAAALAERERTRDGGTDAG